MAQFQDLPEELLTLIFSKLHLPDRKNLRLVCRSFLTPISDLSIIKNDLLHVDYQKIDSYISPRMRYYVNLKLYLPSPQNNQLLITSSKFWEEYGEHVEFVATNFYNSDVLIEIAKNCPKLNSLSIGAIPTDSRWNVLLELPKLHSLDFPYSYRNGGDGRKFSMKITRAKFQISFLPNEYAFLDDGDILIRKGIYSVVDKYIENNCSNLSEFKLKNAPASAAEISAVINLLSDGLLKLDLRGCAVSALILSQISEKMTNLQELSLGYHHSDVADYISPQALIKVIDNLPLLTYLDLDHLPQAVTNEIIPAINKLTNLRCLKLTQTRELTGDGLEALFNDNIRTELVQLRLYDTDVDDLAFLMMSPQMPNLLYLNVKLNRVTESLLDSLAMNNKKLQYLLIDEQVVTSTFAEKVSALKELIFLDILGLYRGAYDNEIGLLDNLRRIQLSKLQVIRLAPLEDLKPTTLTSLFENCPSLKCIIYNNGFDSTHTEKLNGDSPVCQCRVPSVEHAVLVNDHFKGLDMEFPYLH